LGGSRHGKRGRKSVDCFLKKFFFFFSPPRLLLNYLDPHCPNATYLLDDVCADLSMYTASVGSCLTGVKTQIKEDLSKFFNFDDLIKDLTDEGLLTDLRSMAYNHATFFTAMYKSFIGELLQLNATLQSAVHNYRDCFKEKGGEILATMDLLDR